MGERVSIIIPVLNEARRIERVLNPLLGRDGLEVIVVDGGSRDGTAELARSSGARVLSSAPSRARQMNAGRRAAEGGILIFLHGDTLPPLDFVDEARRVLSLPGVAGGAFRLAIDRPGLGFRIIEKAANLRSTLLQCPYGDQAIFVTAERFDQVGGFPEMPIMEDFEFVRRLRRHGRIRIAASAAVTSGRRWEQLGLTRTTLVNWAIVAAYSLGASPERLARWYGRRRAAAAPAADTAPKTSP